MRCEKCNYLNTGKGKCWLCGDQMTEEVVKKPYKIPKRSDKGADDKKKDIAFYKQCFEYAEKRICEECQMPLGNVWRPEFCSHILTKQYRKFRWDERNHNLLCLEHHTQWEFGDRKSMKIYKTNAKVIQELMDEYYPKKDGEEES